MKINLINIPYLGAMSWFSASFGLRIGLRERTVANAGKKNKVILSKLTN